MARTKISGIVYLVIAIVILIPSFLIDAKKFFLFIIIGIIFVAVGMIKIIFNKNDPTNKKKGPDDLGALGDYQRNLKKQPYTSVRGPKQVLYCSECGFAAKVTDQFCKRCGTKL